MHVVRTATEAAGCPVGSASQQEIRVITVDEPTRTFAEATLASAALFVVDRKCAAESVIHGGVCHLTIRTISRLWSNLRQVR